MSIRPALALAPILISTLACVSGCASSPPPRTAASQASAQASGSRGSSSSSTARAAGWVLVAVGAQAGAVAIGTSALMIHADVVRADECDAEKRCTADGLRANGRLESLAPWNVGAWGVTAAALGGGLYLVLSNPKSGEAVGIAPAPGGAVLEGKF